MRFFYVVRPSFGQWEVTFGEHGSRFLYSGKDEAIQVATGAARLHWESRHEPSGVRLEQPGHAPSDIASFGQKRPTRNTPVP
jgi:hypothetical protein